MLTPKWPQKFFCQSILVKPDNSARDHTAGAECCCMSVLLIQPQVSTLLHLSFNALSKFEALPNLISTEKYFTVKFPNKLHHSKKRKLKKSEEKLIQFRVFTSLQSLASSCHKFISLQKAACYILNQS